MLAPVTHFQPIIQGSPAPQSTSPKENPASDASGNADKHTSIKSEAAKLTQKGAEALTRAEQATVQKLKSRDQEVRAHEQAHLSAAGNIAVSGASFTYTIGPNGVKYATGGEVNISTSPVEDDPAATLSKADTIRRAALAPASPSSQDLLVASKATAMAQTARTELIQQTDAESQKTKPAEEDNEKSEEQQNTETAERNEDRPAAGATIDVMV